MTDSHNEISPKKYARFAGLLYLVIIVFGLSGEILVRSALIVPGDPTATASNILTDTPLFRTGFFADSIMFLCDVALAVLIYILLKPAGKVIALAAMCFRLAQSAVLALNLLHYHAALMILNDSGIAGEFTGNQLNALAAFFLDLHSYGYDLGLLFFGVHCLLLGYLVFQSGYLPKILGVLTVAAGSTYLAGSYIRFLLPDYVEVVQPVYIICIVTETALCLWLLIKGVDEGRWKRF